MLAQMMADIADLTERNSHLLEQIDGLKAQVQSVTESAAATSTAAAAAAAVLAADSAAEFPTEVLGHDLHRHVMSNSASRFRHETSVGVSRQENGTQRSPCQTLEPSARVRVFYEMSAHRA